MSRNPSWFFFTCATTHCVDCIAMFALPFGTHCRSSISCLACVNCDWDTYFFPFLFTCVRWSRRAIDRFPIAVYATFSTCQSPRSIRTRFSHVTVTFCVGVARSLAIDDRTTDVDECLEWSMCPGRCQNTIGSYVCITMKSFKDAPYEACPPGYQWDSRASVCAGNEKLCVISCGTSILSDNTIRGGKLQRFFQSVSEKERVYVKLTKKKERKLHLLPAM